MSHHSEKFGSFLRREFARFLLKKAFIEPGIFVSIVGAEADNSGESAKIYVSIFPKSAEKETLKILKEYKNDAQKYLAGRIRRRRMPKINFLLAETERVAKLEKLLEKIKN